MGSGLDLLVGGVDPSAANKIDATDYSVSLPKLPTNL